MTGVQTCALPISLRAETGLQGASAGGGVWGEISFSPYEDIAYAFGAEFAAEAGVWTLDAEAGLDLHSEADLEIDLTLEIDTGTHAVTAGCTLSFEDVGGISGGPVFGWEAEAGYKFRMSRAVSK